MTHSLAGPAADSDAQLRARMRQGLGTKLADLAMEFATEPGDASAALTDALRRQLNARIAKGSDWQPAAVRFDFAADPEAPDWIVHRAVERGTVVILSGDTGAAKSIVASSVVQAALAGEDWLGRSTHAERVMVIDEENPDRLVTARLRALGMENDHRDRLRYFNREGIAIGDDGQTDAWLAAELDDFQPDLLVIDTLMAAGAVEDTNSNSEAVRMMKALRALAREYGCGVLLLHHERKRSLANPTNSGQAMMGARQWAGQADGQMTLTVESDLIEDEQDDGTRRLRRTFKFRPAEKDRDGSSNRPRRLAVESTKDERGRLLTMTVTDEGPIDNLGARETSEVAILGTLRDATAPLGRKDIAAAVGEADPRRPSGTFIRALAQLVDAAKLERQGHGYALTDHGRASLPLEF